MTAARLAAPLQRIHSDDPRARIPGDALRFSRREPVTAVLAGSDQIARGVYEALNQAGLRIPDDICVAGFNDTEALLMNPPLTSVREFPEELGKHLADLVRAACRSRTEAAAINHPDRVMLRESTRPRIATPDRATRRREATVLNPEV